MGQIILQEPDQDEFKGQGSAIELKAQGLQIKTQADYDEAGKFLLNVKSISKRLLERFDEPCRKAREAWQSMTRMRDEACAPFVNAEQVTKQKMGRYTWEQEEIRRKEAEKLRIKAEADARALREKQIAEAKKLKDKEAVAALREAPLEVAAVQPKTQETERVDGVSHRKAWTVQSVDAAKLPLRYLTPDMKAINATVRGLGAKHGIPGVTVVEETITSVRSE